MQNCGYCQGGELLAKFGIKICDLDVSQLILFKEQSHPGRCIVAYKDHVSELVNISDDERNRYFADVAKAANAIHKAFAPKKVNYGAYGDTGCHLHFHLVPKYEDDPLNSRISGPVLQGHSLIATIDNIPCTIQLPSSVIDAYRSGALPLNTLANAVLAKSDQMQRMASQNYEQEQRETITRVRGIQ